MNELEKLLNDNEKEKMIEQICTLNAAILGRIMFFVMIVLFVIWLIERIEFHFLWVLSPIPIAFVLHLIITAIIRKRFS